MSSSGGSFGSVSVHIGADWMLRCHTYPDRPPIMTVHAGECTVSFYVADGTPAGQTVAFARELATAAQKYAVECERVQQATDSTEPADTQAA